MLNLELTVKSLTHQVFFKGFIVIMSLEDDNNYILINTAKKNQLIRSPELCMVHKKTQNGLLIVFSYYTKLCHIVLLMLKIHLQFAFCIVHTQ